MARPTPGALFKAYSEKNDEREREREARGREGCEVRTGNVRRRGRDAEGRSHGAKSI